MATALRPRKNINYKLMSDGEYIHFGKEKRTITTVLEEELFVERFIWKRNCKSVNQKEFLVKWQGFHNYDCTWEPERHLPVSVLSNFVPVEIESERLRNVSRAFELAIRARLKSKQPKSVFFADYDIMRHIFGVESFVLCNISDFEKLNLPDNWFYDLQKDGSGRKIRFPIKLSVRLCMRKVFIKVNGCVTRKEVPIERIRVYSCTEACTASDI